jgi:acyl carrier protein
MKQLSVDVEDTVKQVVLRKAKQNPDPARITPGTSLLGKELGLDSVDLFEVVLSLEKELGIILDEADLSIEVFTSIGSLADHIKKKCCHIR